MARLWTLHEQLGQGGFGRVFRARLRDGRWVAIKRLAPEHSTGEYLESFRKEAEIAGKLDHPNIVALQGVEAERDGHLCLIMELVDGIDLAQLLRFSRVSVDVALHIGRALLTALAYVHETAGVVHRDLSPHNVMLSWDGDVKLSDFGIAKTIGAEPTRGRARRGKLGYMSPEHFQQEPVDARSDLFVVGIVLYQLLSGSAPYGDSTDDVVAFLTGAAQARSLAERCPGISPELCAVVMRLLAREPASRYQSAQEALDALPDSPHGREELQALMQHLRGLGLIGQRKARWQGQRRSRILQAALVLLAAGISAWAAWGLWDAPSSEDMVTAEPAPLLIMPAPDQPVTAEPNTEEPATASPAPAPCNEDKPPLGRRNGTIQRKPVPAAQGDMPKVHYAVDSLVAWPP